MRILSKGRAPPPGRRLRGHRLRCQRGVTNFTRGMKVSPVQSFTDSPNGGLGQLASEMGLHLAGRFNCILSFSALFFGTAPRRIEIT